ncbi:MAG: hypothetical protein STSR0001_18240 [Methanothrix sp.]
MVADVWTMFWHEIGEEDETSADRLQTVEIVYESEVRSRPDSPGYIVLLCHGTGEHRRGLE